MSYLVDTSIWINFIRGGSKCLELEAILDKKIPFYLCEIVYQEILQGARSQKDFNVLSEYFSTQRFVFPKTPVKTYAQSAQIYFEARRAGVTIRSSVDCLIARLALEHGLILLHADRDFERIAGLLPEFKQIYARFD